MFYVYQLYSQKDKGFYIGYTTNIEGRIKKHNNGEVISTKDRRPLLEIYREGYISEKDAKGREKFLKSGAGRRFLKKQLRNTYKDLGITD
ncbi:MAG: GIY-YIG nuclease family protein [Candidatus Omnitrophica bacterium]|nr:GIY-YIG nuclease family protein [Candidatus Omnitrophota bacterium]